jgi:cytochrome c553
VSVRRASLITLAAVVLVVVGLALAGPALRQYWSARAANPVRRGVALARDLGCFACHGDAGGAGIPDPGGDDLAVPAWSGGLWMMYVEDDDEIREFILDGVSRARAESRSGREERERMAIAMPAYRSILGPRETEDLVAAFRVLSGMSRPPSGTPEGRGHDLARSWGCFSCHGPGGCGGRPNPGSLAGFVPGWYGPDFDDLVRDRGEFDTWIREGRIPRLDAHPVGSLFLERQRLRMPPYRGLTDADLDDLWAYVAWLEQTGGGVRPEER